MSDRHAACLFLALASTTLCAQTASPADPLLSLSPQAAYDQALLPVEIVHRSVGNWSPSETASLGVAIAQAQTFCQARPASQLTGPDLLGLARLCALGQLWPEVLAAADRFVAATPAPTPAGTPPSTALPAPATPSPRAEALAFKIEAALNLRDSTTALSTAHLLLRTEPYTPLVQQCTTGVLRNLELIQTADAIDLAGKRLDHILPLLQASATGSPAASPTPATPSSPAAAPAVASVPFAPHELYAAALVTPTLLQLEDDAGAATATVSNIQAALPTGLSSDEQTLIALARRHYDLLGSPLPEIPVSTSLMGASGLPHLDRDFGSATVLLVFPDWCAQCVRIAAKEFTPFLARHAGDGVHLLGLLAQPVPPPLLAPSAPRRHSPQTPAPTTTPAAPLSPADLLRGTPTLVVPASLPLTGFSTTDFPLLVVTDHTGHIRYTGIAPDDAFAQGSLVDQILTRIASLWPAAGAHP